MPTRTQYRATFARDLKAFRTDTATGGSASALIAAKWPWNRTETRLNPSDQYEGWFIYRPSAASALDLVRQIGKDQYDPDTGTITPDVNMTNAWANGNTFELHGHGIEPNTDLHDLINQGLKRILIPVQACVIPNVASTGNRLHNLTDGDGSATVHAKLAALLSARWVGRIDLLPAGTEEVATIVESGPITSGTFAVTFRGNATSAVAHGATAATLQLALNSVPGLEEVTVVRTGSAGLYTFTVTMTGAPLDCPPLTISSNTTDGTLTVTVTRQQGFPSPVGGRLYQQGPHVLFQAHDYFASGDRLYLSTLVRAYDWCRVDSTAAWGSLSGLSAEAHQAVPTEEIVSAAAQIEAWLRYPALMEDAWEQRRIWNLAEVTQRFNELQGIYLGGFARSPLLTIDAEDIPPSAPPVGAASAAGGGA